MLEQDKKQLIVALIEKGKADGTPCMLADVGNLLKQKGITRSDPNQGLAAWLQQELERPVYATKYRVSFSPIPEEFANQPVTPKKPAAKTSPSAKRIVAAAVAAGRVETFSASAEKTSGTVSASSSKNPPSAPETSAASKPSSAPARRKSVLPRKQHSINDVRFTQLRKLIRDNLDRNGAIDLVYLHELMQLPRHGFGTWANNLAYGESSRHMRQWAAYHFSDEYVLRQPDPTTALLVRRADADRPPHPAYPPVELDPAGEEAQQTVAQLRALAVNTKFSDLITTLRRLAGYTGQDAAWWSAFAARQLVLALSDPRQYCIDRLPGPTGLRRMAVRLPRIETPQNRPIYFILEEQPADKTDTETPSPWRLVECCRLEAENAGHWFTDTLLLRSREFLAEAQRRGNKLPPEQLDSAVDVWRALLRERPTILQPEDWRAIRWICQLSAGWPARSETAILLHRLYLRDSATNPLSAALVETSRLYLQGLSGISPALLAELSPAAPNAPKTLFEILCSLPTEGLTLRNYFTHAGVFVAHKPGDFKILARYALLVSTDICSPEEAEALLRTAYNHSEGGSWQALKNLPLEGRTDLQQALLSVECLDFHTILHSLSTTPHPEKISRTIHRSACNLSAFAVRFSLEDRLMEDPEIMAYLSSPAGAGAQVCLLSLMLLAGHTATVRRYLDTAALAEGMTYRALFRELQEMPAAQLEEYARQPWLVILLRLLLPDGKMPAFGNAVDELVCAGQDEALSAELLHNRILAAQRIVRLSPGEHSFGALLFLLCKQAAAFYTPAAFPEALLPVLYQAEYTLCMKFLETGAGDRTISDRQSVDKQFCDMILLGCLLERLGMAAPDGLPLPSSAVCKEWQMRLDTAAAQNPRAKSEWNLTLNSIRSYYAQTLSALSSTELKTARRIILVRLTGVWKEEIAAMSAETPGQPAWADLQEWLWDPVQSASFHNIGILSGILQHYAALPGDAERAALLKWIQAQVSDGAAVEDSPRVPSVGWPSKDGRKDVYRPFMQACYLLGREPDKNGLLKHVPKGYLLDNADLFDSFAEELQLPERLLRRRLLSVFPEGVEALRGQDYDRLCKRIRLTLLMHGDYIHTLDAGDPFFFRKKDSREPRNLDMAYAYYHAAESFAAPYREGVPECNFYLLSDKSGLQGKRAQTCAYACKILASIEKRGKYSRALTLNAFLQVLCSGCDDDVPVFLSKHADTDRIFLRKLYARFTDLPVTTAEEALAFARTLAEEVQTEWDRSKTQDSFVLADSEPPADSSRPTELEFLILMLLERLYPQLAVRRNLQARFSDLGYRDTFVYLPPDQAELLIAALPELPPLQKLQEIPGFLDTAEDILDDLQRAGRFTPPALADTPVGLRQQLAATAAPLDRIAVLLALYYLCPEEADARQPVELHRNVVGLELGTAVLDWLLKEAAVSGITEKAYNDTMYLADVTFFRLALLRSRCNDEERETPTAKAFTARIAAYLSDLLTRSKSLRAFLQIYDNHCSTFNAMIRIFPQQDLSTMGAVGFNQTDRELVGHLCIHLANLWTILKKPRLPGEVKDELAVYTAKKLNPVCQNAEKLGITGSWKQIFCRLAELTESAADTPSSAAPKPKRPEQDASGTSPTRPKAPTPSIKPDRPQKGPSIPDLLKRFTRRR